MKKTLAAFIVCVIAATAFAAGMLFASPTKPTILASPVAITKVPVTSRVYDDNHNVEISITESETQQISAPRDGKVTAVDCAPGGAFVSGGSSYSIDGVPILTLHTRVPLWRDLAIGDTGADVEGLQNELQRLGYTLTPSGRYTQATLVAVRDVLRLIGHPLWREAQLEYRSIQWIPQPETTVATCSIGLGKSVKADDVIAELPSQIVRAAISSMPQKLTPGERILSIDGQNYDVGADGVLSNPEQLQQLATSQSYLLSKTNENASIYGSFQLKTPLDVQIVPPGALAQIDDGSGCVIADDTARAVTIIGSELGQTFVTFNDGTIPKMVESSVQKATTCG